MRSRALTVAQGVRASYAAVAAHRLAQLGDLKLSFNVEAEPRAAAWRVGIRGRSPVVQKLLAPPPVGN